MADDKTYVVLEEGNGLVVALKERYPYEMQNVKPEEIIVLAIMDDPPEFKDWLAKIHLIKGAPKALLEMLRSKARYYIEVYSVDWVAWNKQLRQVIIFHELLHVPPEDANGIVKHDVEDFSPVLEAFGLNYQGSTTLPDMLSGEPIKFNRRLIDSLLNQKKKKDEDDEPGDQGLPPPMVNLK
jgi:hypothetical protein